MRYLSWDRICARLTVLFLSLFLPKHSQEFMRVRHPYADWQDVNRLNPTAISDLTSALRQADGALPRISVLMPIYRPDMVYFRAAVASVKSQIYEQWQLCLCDDASQDPSLSLELQQLAATDFRIVVAQLSENRGISEATNAAAAMADGDVFLFLDQDDLLAPDCLAEFALAFADNPTADIAYSDSDKIDSKNIRNSPSFKPDWSPWLLLSYMYISHAFAIKRSLFIALGGLRGEYNGSQDYDLILRASEMTNAVCHIPRILYHWRAWSGSTALNADQKPGSIDAGRRALQSALDRRGIAAKAVQPMWAQRAGIGLFDICFPELISSASAILLLDGHEDTEIQWLETILPEIPTAAQIIIVSPCPFEERYGAIKRRDCTLVQVDRNGTLSENLTKAFSHATGDLILCIKAGLKPSGSQWFASLCGYAEASGGIVAPRIVDHGDRLVSAGYVLPHGSDQIEPAFAGWDKGRPGYLYLAKVTHECVALSALCFALHRKNYAVIIDALIETGQGADPNNNVSATPGKFLVCGGVDLLSGSGGPMLKAKITSKVDPWYNENLGRGEGQFLPRIHCRRLRDKAPVRLVVVTHNLDREGAQSTLLDLIVGLKQTEYADPVVISSCTGMLSDALCDNGISVEIVQRPRRRASNADIAVYRLNLRRIFERTGAQVVLANTLESYQAVGAATEAGMGVLWWQHEGGVWHQYFRKLPWRAKAQAYAAFAQSYRVVQVAEATRLSWLPIARRDNFEVIRLGIPPERMFGDLDRWERSAARSSLNTAEHEICVLLLGSVSARKAQSDILHALENMTFEEIGALKIWIAGQFVDSDYQMHLDSIIRSLPANIRQRVELLGAVPDASQYYAAADIFLCCSREESSPRSIVEAMSFGLPVISTPVDGIPEIVINGVNGLFYQPGDTLELSRRLKQLCASKDLRRELGQAGRDRVLGTNDYGRMLERFGALLREAAWSKRDIAL